MINTGRCNVSAGAGSDADREVWPQADRAKYEMRSHEQRRWYVAESESHDDRIVRLALCCWAADLAAAPAEDAVVPAQQLGYETGWYGRRW